MSGRMGGTLIGAAIGVGAVFLAPATFGTSLAVGAATISAGASIGGFAGGLYDSATQKFDDVVNRQERLADLAIQTSTLGTPITQIWGTIGGVAGNIIWATDKEPHEHREEIEAESAGKGGPTGPKQINITITYTQSYAIALCDTRLSGPIAGILKIWKNSNLFWDVTENGPSLPAGWTFYTGTDDQDPDPTIEADKGSGNVPRYPYLCYVVVADDDLGQSGQTPVYTFELAQLGATGVIKFSSLAVSPANGDVWVSTGPREELWRYDETTRERVAVVTLGDAYGQGNVTEWPLAFDTGGVLWAGDPNAGTVVRIDGSTNAILSTISLEDVGVKRIANSNIVFSGGDAWLTTYDPETIANIALNRITSAGVITVIDLSIGGLEPRIAVGGDGDIWVAGDGLKRVDVGTLVVTTIATVGQTEDILVDAIGDIWVIDLDTADTVSRVDPGSNTVTDTLSTCPSPNSLGLASDGFVWVNDGNTSGRVSRINPTTATVQTFAADGRNEPWSPNTAWAPGASGAMWVISAAANTATLISTTGTTMAVQTALVPISIATGAGTSVWVVSHDGGELQQIDVSGSVLSLSRTAAPNSLPTIVETLCNAVGLTDHDVSELPDNLVNMILVNVEAARAPLEQLAQAFRFYAVESGFDLKFRERGSGGLVFAIGEEELGAGENQASEDGLQVRRLQESDLPTTIEVAYIDPHQNYQRNTQPGQLALPASGIENRRSINVGSLALQADDARQLATELAVEAWVQRESLSSTLMRKYAWIEPGDRGTFTARGLTYTAVITETAYGAPGLVEFTALVDAAYIRNAIMAPPGVVTPTPQPPVIAGDTEVILANFGALTSSDVAARYHVVYVGENEPWEGGALYRSTDGEASYHLLDSAALEGITGTVALALATADYHVLDTTTTFSVVLEYGSLSSVSDLQLFNGANLVAIGSEANGWEILGIGVATLTATRTYTCSRLLRGRRGTEHQVSTHGVNETFIKLDAGARAVSMTLADRHVERPYKGVSVGQDISTVTAVDFTPTAQNLNGWSVAQPDAELSGSDWRIFWRYRSRFAGDWVDGGGIGWDVDHAGFRIEFFSDGTFTTVVRTVTTDGGSPIDPEAEMEFLYTLAMQTTDYGGAQAPWFQVYEITNNGISVAEAITAS